MRDFLHRQYQGMDRPTLLDRMQLDEPQENRLTLLERMEAIKER